MAKKLVDDRMPIYHLINKQNRIALTDNNKLLSLSLSLPLENAVELAYYAVFNKPKHTVELASTQ